VQRPLAPAGYASFQFQQGGQQLHYGQQYGAQPVQAAASFLNPQNVVVTPAT
jgi:hypothetical protein